MPIKVIAKNRFFSEVQITGVCNVHFLSLKHESGVDNEMKGNRRIREGE